MLRNLGVGLTGGVLGAICVLLVQGQPFNLAPVGMSYAELAATLLGAAGVLVAIIGIFIAALAIWGFTAFRSIAKNSAKSHVNQQLRQGELRTHVETVVTDFLKAEFEGGELQEIFERRLDEIIVSAAQRRAQNADTSEDDVPVGDL